ncbi:MAG TPA: cupin, partial [Planctomycetota bacterium]|nr:cupin [Planctomycetota bacterium]
MASASKNYCIEHFSEIEPVRCPCGWSRRAFVSPDNPLATMHCVDIQEDAQTHYHKRITEIYLILEVESEAFME